MLDMKTGGKRPRHPTVYRKWGGGLMILETDSPTVPHCPDSP